MHVSNPREDGGNTDGFVSPPRTKLTTPPRTDLYGKHALSRKRRTRGLAAMPRYIIAS